MKKVFLSLILAAASIIMVSCEKEDELIKEDINDVEDVSITKSKISGAVQKGPFLNGTTIDFYELDTLLIPTGKSFSAQILDNSGLFELNNLDLVSPYIQIKADGYYFNELTGENSVSPIILYALADITDKNTVNVNVLSHLAKGRIEYLMANEGISFADANNQAKQEILDVFSLQKSDISDFDMLDIAEAGDDNAILLAISLITQGYRSESEFSNLLANINTDIRQDGELNSASLGSLLINDARLFDLVEIRENIESRYQDMGITTSIPDFETYINAFIDSTQFEITNNIEYPEISDYQKLNLLYPDGSDTATINDFAFFSVAANLPDGASLKVIFEPVDADSLPDLDYFGVQTLPNGPVNFVVDYSGVMRNLTSIDSGYCDALVSFMHTGYYCMKIYENGDEEPQRTKIINVIESPSI